MFELYAKAEFSRFIEGIEAMCLISLKRNEKTEQSVLSRGVVYGLFLSAVSIAIAFEPSIVYGQKVHKVGTGEPSELIRQQNKTSQAKTLVTLVVREKTIGTLMQTLGEQIDCPVVFDGTDPRFARKVSVGLTNVPVMEAFAKILQGTGLVAVRAKDGRTIVVRGKDTKTSASETIGAVFGIVLDSAMQIPLAGVSVSIAGSKLSMVTKENGIYALVGVPAGPQVVTFKLLGYRSVSRTVVVVDNNHHGVNVSLAPAATMLSGVVTTATGAQDRKAVGNDITVINADSVMRVAPVTSVTDLLATRVPGLTVQRTSGAPGAPSRIRLRGIGGGLVDGAANTSNDPIVIVDGIRVYAQQSTERDRNLASRRGVSDQVYNPASALDQIDPNSIETIEVFKGPSATSQWGADAGNGVIVITTKRGRAGSTQVSSSLSTSVERLPGQYAPPGFYRFAHGMEQTKSRLCGFFDYSGVCSETDSVVRFQALNSPGLSPFGTGTGHSGSLSISGGTDAMTYALTGSVQDQLGYLRMPRLFEELFRLQYGIAVPGWIRRPNTYQSSGVSTSVTANPSQTLRLGFTTSLSQSRGTQASGQNELASLSGKYLDTAFFRQFPINATRQYVERSQSRNVTSNIAASADWSRWTWLPMRLAMGVNTMNREDRVTVPFGLARGGPTDTLGIFGLGRGQAVTRSGSGGATLWSGGLVATAVGVQITQTSTSDFSARADTLRPGVREPTSFNQSGQQTFASTTAGWYVEPRLNLNSRFFVSPGFRFDGGSASSSRTGGGGVMALFPKLNFSWIAIDREGQVPLGGVLTMLRPRLGFGVAGVQPDPTWKLRLMTEGYSLGSSTQTKSRGVILHSLGNPELHPERSQEIEAGFDADLWEGRVSLTVSAYSKVRNDAIQELYLPPSAGIQNSYYTNVGRIRNTGTELSVTARVIENSRLTWGISGSLSTNRNTLVTLAGDLPYIDGGDGTRLQAGYPISGRWGRPILGYRTPTSDRLTVDDVALGDSAVYLGSGFPKWQLPVQTNLSFWNGTASINAEFSYTNGLTQFNAGNVQRLASLYADPVASLGQQAVALMAYACSPTQVISSGECYNGTIYGLVQTVNSLRFSTISINYNIPRTFSSRFRLPRTSIALQGNNLALWTNYRGKDPDVNGTTVGETVTDSGQLPQPRRWTIRMTFTN